MLNNTVVKYSYLSKKKYRLPSVRPAGFQKKPKKDYEQLTNIRIKRHTEVWQSGQMRQTVNLLPSGYVRFESHNFHNERRNSSLTYWYNTKSPPQGWDRHGRLTIRDPCWTTVRVVLPAATLARYEKNYLSLYTDISADVCRLVGAVGSVFIPGV